MFNKELSDARQRDQVDLSQKLDQLSVNDHEILAAIEDQNGVYRRMEDLLLAIFKV